MYSPLIGKRSGLVKVLKGTNTHPNGHMGKIFAN